MTTIIEDAKIYATHAKKSTVDADDIKLAIQCRMDQSFTSPPPRDVSAQEYLLYRVLPLKYHFVKLKFSKLRTHFLSVCILCVQFLLEVARQKNQTPLPLIKPYTGPRLPPDRYCLTAPNYRLKSAQKKVTMSTLNL